MSRDPAQAERPIPEFHGDGVTDFRDALRWREHRRIPVILPAKLETPRVCLDSVILDISLGGARGWLNEPIRLQSDAALAFEKFGRLDADILCVTRQANKRFEFRLQFKLDPRAIAQRLSSYLSSSPDSLYSRASDGRTFERRPQRFPAQIRVH